MVDATEHLEVLATAYEAAVGDVTRAAQAAHAQIDGDLETLQQLGGSTSRPPLIADVPIDEPPPYVPPSANLHAYNALIPDTPLVESQPSSASLSFDDAPLWQS